MQNTNTRVGFILIAVIVFPTLFFSAYEVSNLRSNQNVVDSIYSSQLKSIVSSVNQYSVQAITNWVKNIEVIKQNTTENHDSVFEKFITEKTAIQGVFFSNFSSNITLYTLPTQASYSQEIEKYLVEQDSNISVLLGYINNDYQKIQPVYFGTDTMQMFLFALRDADSVANIGGVLINGNDFVPEVLGPKLQSMAQDNFIISIYSNNNTVYANTSNLLVSRRVLLREPLWLFKDFEVGIQLINDPVEQMVKKRTQINILLIILMDLILIIGAWFVYKSLRQQIKLAQIKSEFVSNVSHEIKTPLALISMYSETLELGRIPTEEKKLEYFKVINKEAKRLSRMVNKILSFSKIDSGRRQYSFVETDLNEVIDQVVATYQHHFKNSGFDFNIHYTENLPFVKLDEEAIIDAVSNLIDNGMKYSADIKKIELRTFVEQNKVSVEIKDSGIGIKQKEQKLIFDKFYRVTEGNLANMAKGSGIGLNIVKNIMDAHGGSIGLKSEFGKGSSFILNFPALL